MPQLSRKKIVVTRPKSIAGSFAQMLVENNLQPVFFPLIELRPASQVKLTINKIAEQNKGFDWLIFTSPSAVGFYYSLPDNTLKVDKIAVVGDKTAKALQKYGLRADLISSKADFDTLMNELQVDENMQVLFPHSAKTKPVQLEKLREKVTLTDFVLYDNFPVLHTKEEWKDVLLSADAFTFFSPSSVNSFCEQIKKYSLSLPQTLKFYSIGNKTAAALQQCGFGNTIFTSENGKTDELLQIIVNSI